MKIVVCIKQVPDTNEVKLDPKTNRLIRDGVPSIINHAANAAGKFRAAIISQLIDMDIPDDARTKALRLVKEA